MIEESRLESTILSGIAGGSVLAKNYGTDDQLLALALRIELVHSKSEMLGAEGCLRMAQISLATGAKALPEEAQEIHAWKEGAGGLRWTNQQDNITPLTLSIGFDFYNRMAAERGGFIQVMQPRAMTKQERKDHGVMATGLAQICKIVRRQDIIELRQLEIPYKEILETCAVFGIGVLSAIEIETSEKVVGRSFLWKCNRRAIKDALRLAFGNGIPLTMEPVFSMASNQETATVPAAQPVIVDKRFVTDEHDAAMVFDKQMPAEPVVPASKEWSDFIPSGQKPLTVKVEDANDIFFNN